MKLNNYITYRVKDEVHRELIRGKKLGKTWKK